MFSTSHIKEGEKINTLFNENDVKWVSHEEYEKLKVSPELKDNFAIQYDDGYSMPADFNCMSVGWYLNHAAEPNLHFDEEYEYFASRDIHPDEELFINYDKL
ncbi:MAG: SET domain-containing protein [Ignavibacteria bacterium]